ncbi:MAG: group 1 truncated hemoglobin [Ketobacter sp.]
MKKLIQAIMKASTLIVGALLLSACQSVHNETTLYDELGGLPAIEKIVDGFIYQVGFDEQIVQHFEQTDLDRFRSKLIEQICEVSDGPCQYSGDSMLDVHANMDINESEFNRTVDLLIMSMEKHGIPQTTQNKLLSRLAPLRPDIIYH